MADRKTEKQDHFVVTHRMVGQVNGFGPWLEGDMLHRHFFTKDAHKEAVDHEAQIERLLSLGAIRPATDDEKERSGELLKEAWDRGTFTPPSGPTEAQLAEREAMADARPGAEPAEQLEDQQKAIADANKPKK